MKRLKRKLTNRFLTIAIVSVLITALSVTVACWLSFSSQAYDDLEGYGRLICQSYNQNESLISLKNAGVDNLRITLIDSRGNVLYESSSDVSTGNMSNHLSRPEIKEALTNGSGTDSRISDTLGKVTHYYAKLTDNGNVLRVAMEINSVIPTLLGIIPVLLFIIAYVLIICLIVASESTKKIVEPIEKMTEDIKNVAYQELVPFANTIEKQQNEIKKQMERLQLEKDRINALIANMSEGFILLDMDKIILAENDSAAILLGSTHSDCIGKNVIEFSRNKEFISCVEEALKGHNQTASFEHGGEVVEVLSSPVFSKNTQTGVICLIVDITQRVKAEKLRREFTANVSHELKTPLTSISGYAEMIENGMAKNRDVKKFAGKIRKEAARLLTLIGDIIQLSHLDEPDKSLDKQDTSLLELSGDVADSLAPGAEKKGVSIKTSGDEARLMCNRDLIYQVIYNLCDNAVRYNCDGGAVDIIITDLPGEAKITVKDTGIGIPQRHLGRIFERFYRVDKSRSKETGGTGLGLAIVKHIVEQHNGKIELESEENKGTKITVTLPK